MRLSENVHLLCYPHPSSLRRTSMYASFLRISEALHLDIFHQPPKGRFFDSLVGERTGIDLVSVLRPELHIVELTEPSVGRQQFRVGP